MNHVTETIPHIHRSLIAQFEVLGPELETVLPVWPQIAHGGLGEHVWVSSYGLF